MKITLITFLLLILLSMSGVYYCSATIEGINDEHTKLFMLWRYCVRMMNFANNDLSEDKIHEYCYNSVFPSTTTPASFSMNKI